MKILNNVVKIKTSKAYKKNIVSICTFEFRYFLKFLEKQLLIRSFVPNTF